MRKQYHFWPGVNGLDAWDVHRLVELSAGLPAEEVPLDQIAEIDLVYWLDGDRNQPTVRAIVDHIRLVDEVDQRYPIILGPDGRVMDGMHRIAKALLSDRQTITAVRFTELPSPDYVNCRPNELPYD